MIPAAYGRNARLAPENWSAPLGSDSLGGSGFTVQTSLSQQRSANVHELPAICADLGRWRKGHRKPAKLRNNERETRARPWKWAG